MHTLTQPSGGNSGFAPYPSFSFLWITPQFSTEDGFFIGLFKQKMSIMKTDAASHLSPQNFQF